MTLPNHEIARTVFAALPTVCVCVCASVCVCVCTFVCERNVYLCAFALKWFSLWKTFTPKRFSYVPAEYAKHSCLTSSLMRRLISIYLSTNTHCIFVLLFEFLISSDPSISFGERGDSSAACLSRLPIYDCGLPLSPFEAKCAWFDLIWPDLNLLLQDSEMMSQPESDQIPPVEHKVI